MEEQNKITEPMVTDVTPVEPTQTESEVPATEPEVAVEPEVTEPEQTEPAEPEVTETEPEAEPESEAKFTKTFELSHEDIRCGLYGLLAVVEEETQEWCYIREVYDNSFIYERGANLYKQSYSKNDTTVAFEGDPVHINAEYVTDEELAILNEMRTNYPSLVEKLAKYESEPEKLELLNSPDYALIRESEAYKELCKRDLSKQDSYFNLSKEEIAAKCKEIVFEEAKKLGSQYTAKETSKTYTQMPVMPSDHKACGNGRYGSMFVK